MSGPKPRDRTGERYGLLTVVRPAGFRIGPHPVWVCKCDCGEIKNVSTVNLRPADSKYKGARSCGCATFPEKQKRKWTRLTIRLPGGQVTHGNTRDPRMVMYWSSKARAKRTGLIHTIEPADIPSIPSHCALLGIELSNEPEAYREATPSLDRIDNTIGYVKGNLQIISSRANRLKNNASFSEIETLYLNWKALLDPTDGILA